MESLKKTQVAELLLVAAALLVIIIMPLLSTSSLRSANLYFIVNIIIIAVAAEAGLFSFFLLSAGNEKPADALSLVSQQPVIISKEKRPHQSNSMVTQVGAVDDQVHKADPSIFFIEAEARYDEGEEVGEVISGQELFQKAEIFIGNFYKQLNIQREESWNEETP